MRKVLITGTAGFIGFHLARLLLADGFRVQGYDGMTDYYDIRLKQRRHQILLQNPDFTATEALLEDRETLDTLADAFQPEIIVHLAAQAGVRYSIENPRAYLDANIIGTFNVMEAARRHQVRHLLIASTSSVYGANDSLPFAETDKADTPLTIYAASKKATESMSHAYAHLWSIPTTLFRFFTVYGPWGRPDMALYKFTEAILHGRPIEIYNNGEMYRDFTYVTDLVRAIRLLIDVAPPQPNAAKPNAAEPNTAKPNAAEPNTAEPNAAEPDTAEPNTAKPDTAKSDTAKPDTAGPVPHDSLSPAAPWRVVNIGNSEKVKLLDFVDAIEHATGRKAIRHYRTMQPGDVPATWANASLLRSLTGYAPQTDVKDGIAAFVAWYREYYGV